MSGPLQLTGRFYDADNNFLDTVTARLVSLAPGETWEALMPFFGPAAEEVHSHQIDGEFIEDAPDFNPPGIELLDAELTVNNDEAIVTGRAQNTTDSPYGYLEAYVKFYSDSEKTTVLGSEYTNQVNIPAGEAWRFEVQFWDYRRAGQVTAATVLLSPGMF